ncbi:MAG: hypothetical protein V4459_12765 [Pseudomonadota bacterium]
MGDDLRYRLGGLLCLAAAVAFGWWGIVRPYQDAVAHAPKVEYSIKIFILVPALAVFGLFFLIGGARWPYRNAEAKNLTPIGWALMVAVAVISGATFWWLQHTFDALGYTG